MRTISIARLRGFLFYLPVLAEGHRDFAKISPARANRDVLGFFGI